MTVRRLIETDLARMLHIAKLKAKIGGTVPESDTNKFEQIYRKYTLNDGQHFGFGYFENDILISYLGFGLYESKSRGKFWYFAFLHTSKFHPLFTFNEPEIQAIIGVAFTTAEDAGHYDFYYSIAEQVEQVYYEQWQKQTYWPHDYFVFETIAKIPANTLSDVDLYNRLLGGTPKPNIMVIKKRSVKPEYRKR